MPMVKINQKQKLYRHYKQDSLNVTVQNNKLS